MTGKKLALIIVLSVLGAILALAVSLWTALWLVPTLEISNMNHIEVCPERGEPYRIEITADKCRYEADGILKWSPVEGELVMKNGERQPVRYDGHYNVFMLYEKYKGCYVITE